MDAPLEDATPFGISDWICENPPVDAKKFFF